MGKIFYIMGKSSSGKDSIYRQLEGNQELGLKRLVIYTTRPIRDGEENGREYFFADENKLKEFRRNGKLIEARTYQTVYGPWTYFTADDGQVSVGNDSYLGIGTLESFVRLREYYGNEVMWPIYIEVEDGERLERAGFATLSSLPLRVFSAYKLKQNRNQNPTQKNILQSSYIKNDNPH